jgi:hypothetical protein
VQSDPAEVDVSQKMHGAFFAFRICGFAFSSIACRGRFFVPTPPISNPQVEQIWTERNASHEEQRLIKGFAGWHVALQ